MCLRLLFVFRDVYDVLEEVKIKLLDFGGNSFEVPKIAWHFQNVFGVFEICLYFQEYVYHL